MDRYVDEDIAGMCAFFASATTLKAPVNKKRKYPRYKESELESSETPIYDIDKDLYDFFMELVTKKPKSATT